MQRVALKLLGLMLALAVIVVFVGAVWAPVGAGIESTSNSGTFSDDDDSVHEYNIEQIVEWEIGRGCAPGRFCPSTAITRSEMAAWLSRASTRLYDTPSQVEGSISGEPTPAETPASGTVRADSENLEPDGTVTRAEAAEMLVAVFSHLSVESTPLGLFSDASSTSKAAVLAMESLYGAGATKGCAIEPLRYCPNQEITRAQATSLLVRAMLRAEPTVGLVLNEPQTAQGYTLLTAEGSASDSAYLIDHLGRIVHTWKLGQTGTFYWYPKLLKNGNLLIMSRTKVTEITSTGNIVWSCLVPNAHHDFLMLPNGNLLLLARGLKSYEEAVAAGFRPDFIQAGGLKHDYLLEDYLLELKPTGPNTCEVVWKWSVWDHLIQDHDPSKDNFGIIADHPERVDLNYPFNQLRYDRRYDWLHINAIDYNSSLDQIMISVRHYSELWIIDHNTTTKEASGPKGDLLYRWGNPQTYRAGDFEDQRLFRQHNTHWVPPGLPGEGNILIFNNGTGDEGFGFVRWYSSVDEIKPPPFTGGAYQKEPDSAFGPNEVIWTYTAEERTEFWAPLTSGAQRLPNGNTFILDGPQGTIFQVTSEGKTVWKYINPIGITSGLIYQGDHPSLDPNNNSDNRLFRVEWYPPDHPGLQGIDLTPKGPVELYR